MQDYRVQENRLPSSPSIKCNLLRESLSEDSQNIPCATLKRRGSWVIRVADPDPDSIGSVDPDPDSSGLVDPDLDSIASVDPDSIGSVDPVPDSETGSGSRTGKNDQQK